MRRAPIRIPAVILVEERLHVPGHRLVFGRVRTGGDLLPRQIDGKLERLPLAHHRQPGLWGQRERSDRRRVDEQLAARQPMSGPDRHPTNLPCLIVEQEVLDHADIAVARPDRATLKTTNGEQHGPIAPRSVSRRRAYAFRRKRAWVLSPTFAKRPSVEPTICAVESSCDKPDLQKGRRLDLRGICLPLV